MNKYVIYTVVVGNYNKILQPIVKDERFDYVLFSNDFNKKKIGVWNIRSIPPILLNDNKRLSRYPKTHPEELLSEYEYSLYIDANIQIKDSWIYERCLELVNLDVEYAGVKLVLTGCDCIYAHTLDMCSLHVEHDYKAIIQCHNLYKEGFPQHYGLNENNIIFRKNTPIMQQVDEEWWNWIINHSFRDQFSYMFCLWKYKIPIFYIFPEGEDSHNSSHFIFVPHNTNPDVAKKKFMRKTFAEKLRLFLFTIDKPLGRYFWERAYKSKYPILSLYKFSTILFFINIKYLVQRLFK